MQLSKLTSALDIICRDLAIEPVPLFIVPLTGAGRFTIRRDGSAFIEIDIDGCLKFGTCIADALIHEAWHLNQWRTGRLTRTQWEGQPRTKWTRYRVYEQWPWEIEAMAAEDRLAPKYIEVIYG